MLVAKRIKLWWVLLSYTTPIICGHVFIVFFYGRKTVHEAMTPVHMARSKKHPIWVAYAAAAVVCTAHIWVDAGEFRLSAGGRAGAVTAAWWPTQPGDQSPDARTITGNCGWLAPRPSTCPPTAVLLRLRPVSRWRNSNQNSLAHGRTSSPAYPLRCRRMTAPTSSDTLLVNLKTYFKSCGQISMKLYDYRPREKELITQMYKFMPIILI